jgi:hypothetical protein
MFLKAASALKSLILSQFEQKQCTARKPGACPMIRLLHYDDGMRLGRRIAAGAVVLGVMVAPRGVANPPSALAGTLDRQLKLELIEDFPSSPCVVWHGSSTSREANPGQIAQYGTGPAFNASVSAGRPYDHHYMSRAFARRFPSSTIHHVIALDVEQFRKRRDRRIVPRPRRVKPTALSKFTANGFRRRNPYAYATFTQRYNYIIGYYKLAYRSFPSTLSSASKRHTRNLIAAANRSGDAPTVVIMPVHPAFRSELRRYGRDARRNYLKQWLRSQREQGLQFTLRDATNPRTFGGRKRWFHDPVHMQPTNMFHLVRWLGNHGDLSCDQRTRTHTRAIHRRPDAGEGLPWSALYEWPMLKLVPQRSQ